MEVTNKWEIAGVVNVANIDLHAARVSNPSMQEVHVINHRLNKCSLFLEVPIDHLAARIPMREIPVELEVWICARELDGAPHVLEDRRAMGLNVHRHLVFGGSINHGFDQAACLSIVLTSPAHVKRQTFQSCGSRFLRQPICVIRSIHSTASANA